MALVVKDVDLSKELFVRANDALKHLGRGVEVPLVALYLVDALLPERAWKTVASDLLLVIKVRWTGRLPGQSGLEGRVHE